ERLGDLFSRDCAHHESDLRQALCRGDSLARGGGGHHAALGVQSLCHSNGEVGIMVFVPSSSMENHSGKRPGSTIIIVQGSGRTSTIRWRVCSSMKVRSPSQEIAPITCP